MHQGKLALAANEFTVLYLLPILSRFHRMHPTIKIEVSRALASQIPSQVLRHNVEFGILSFEPEDEQLDSVVFYKDDLVFVVYPSHPLARVRKATIRDLGAESFAAHIVLSPYRTKVIQAFKAHHTPLHMNVELPTLESIRSFVRMGQGVALVPRISVENDLRRGDLVDVAVQELRFERKMRIIMRSGATLSHAGSAFLKLCADGQCGKGKILLRSQPQAVALSACLSSIPLSSIPKKRRNGRPVAWSHAATLPRPAAAVCR